MTIFRNWIFHQLKFQSFSPKICYLYNGKLDQKLDEKLIFAFAVIFFMVQVCAAKDVCTHCPDLKQVYQAAQQEISAKAFSGINGLDLTCWKGLDDKNAIGVIQKMVIKANVKDLAAVIDNFPDYPELFTDLVTVSSEPPGPSGQFTVTWVEKPPVFFMGNMTHKMAYKTQEKIPLRKTYRYSLESSSELKYSEGFIALVKIDDTTSGFIESDFYNAFWGAAKILGSGSIWWENLKALAQSDWAVKIKAEDKTIKSKQARDDSRKKINEDYLHNCIDSKKAFSATSLKEAILQSSL